MGKKTSEMTFSQFEEKFFPHQVKERKEKEARERNTYGREIARQVIELHQKAFASLKG